MSTCRTMICLNPDSKFKGRLRIGVKIGFVFHMDSDNCLWPVISSMYELINDGWVTV